MQILQPLNNPGCILSYDTFWKMLLLWFLFLDFLMKVAIFCIFHHNVKTMLITEGSVILNDIRVFNFLQNIHLLLGIWILLFKVLNIDLFNHIDFIILLAPNLVDNPVGASPNLLLELKIIFVYLSIILSVVALSSWVIIVNQQIWKLVSSKKFFLNLHN